MTLQILDFFPAKSITNKVDNFINYEQKLVASIDIEKLKGFDKNSYSEFNSKIISLGYEWNFDIEELSYSITQNNYSEIELDDLDDLKELNITLQIFKKGNKIVVFDESEFISNIQNSGLEDILKIFNTKFKTGIIIINEQKEHKFSSNYIGYNLGLKAQSESVLTISNQCNFNNFSDFKFTPDYFNIGGFVKEDEILYFINKIYQIFILVYICDSSEIIQNEVKLKISGFKTIEYTLNFDELDTSSLGVYAKIFDWIYSEKNKVEDKIGIARNILSIYLKNESILIEENTFNSILSANNTYIKGNISKYIETRNKIHEQIEQISNKVNVTLEAFYNNFQKSIFVFISFYLTIFILKIYTRSEVTSVITKEATIMALGLLFLSFLFLIFSIWVLSLEKIRISYKYSTIKSRGLDLLLQDDIDKILNNDKEYKDEISFLDKRRNLYIGLWITTLLVFLIVLFSTSDYINFKNIKLQENKEVQIKVKCTIQKQIKKKIILKE